MLKIGRELCFWKVERFIFGNVNIAKIYERLLSTNTSEEKRRDSFDARNLNLLGDDSICMVNRMEITGMMTCFLFLFLLLHDLISSVVSEDELCFARGHKNQNVARIGQLLDHIHVEL